jgi:hypothetical protein
MPQAFDGRSFGKAFPNPEKQWVSFATVDADAPDARSVDLAGPDGAPLPYGPMVAVTLQPSGVSLRCRVASQVAGDGEADWHPFVAGDEVIVLLPEGHERAGATIIGRLNQSLDAWPEVVGGQDSTKNTFGFRRIRTPYIVETANAYLVRSALTGSQFGIDAQGQVIINDGDKGTMVIGPDAIGFASGEGDTFVHVLPGDKEVFLGADTASFQLAASESKFISQGAVSFATNGGMANGTAVTAEQVVAFVINVVTACAAAGWVGVPATAAAIAPLVGGALTAMASPVPTDSVPGGVFAPPYFGAVFGPAGGLVAAMSNPLAPIDVTGTIPGFGRPGFKL